MELIRSRIRNIDLILQHHVQTDSFIFNELLRSNEEVKKLSAWRNLLLNSAGEGIFGVDREHRCTFMNPAALTMLGFEEAEVIGQAVHPLFHATFSDGRSVFTDITRRKEMESELLGRIGGEEFGVLLRYTDLSSASRLAEKLRAKDSLDTLMSRADSAMYAAKNAGRDRLEIG